MLDPLTGKPRPDYARAVREATEPDVLSGVEPLTAERARELTEFSLYVKTARTLISDRTFPPGTTYQTPEGLRAEDEATRAALDVQGGIYPIRESVFRESYARDDDAARLPVSEHPDLTAPAGTTTTPRSRTTGTPGSSDRAGRTTRQSSSRPDDRTSDTASDSRSSQDLPTPDAADSASSSYLSVSGRYSPSSATPAAREAVPAEDGLREAGFAADRPTGPRTERGHALAASLRRRLPDVDIDYDAWVRDIEVAAAALASTERAAGDGADVCGWNTRRGDGPLGGPCQLPPLHDGPHNPTLRAARSSGELDADGQRALEDAVRHLLDQLDRHGMGNLALFESDIAHVRGHLPARLREPRQTEGGTDA